MSYTHTHSGIPCTQQSGTCAVPPDAKGYVPIRSKEEEAQVARLQQEARALRQEVRVAMGETPDYVNGEPKPIPNELSPSMHDLVIADMRKRKEYGLNKYQTILQAFNGRSALKDAYEEILDLAVYLRQRLYEESVLRAQTPATQSHQSADSEAQNTARPEIAVPTVPGAYIFNGKQFIFVGPMDDIVFKSMEG